MINQALDDPFYLFNKLINRVQSTILYKLSFSQIGKIKQMNKTMRKMSPPAQKQPSFSGLIQLKLVESSHKGFGSAKQDELNRRLMGSNLNTPSTIADFKKFHSCELVKRNKEQDSPMKQSQQLHSTHRRCESSTKILSLREIKQTEDRGKQKQSGQMQSVGKNSGRKLFVSIARSNSKSKQKRQPVCEINNLECNLVAEEAPKRQKIKINVYKSIARKNTLNLA